MNELHKPIEGSTPIPDYLTRQDTEYDPLPLLNNLIRKKIINLCLLNKNGIDLLDNAIQATFDTTIDLRLKAEAIKAMGRYKKGRRLTKEGIEYKDELEKEEREISPVVKLADLIVNKLAGMDDLSDEQLKELDSSIDEAHKEARKVEISKADDLMATFFMEGRQLTSAASEWRALRPNEYHNLLYTTIEETRFPMTAGTG